MKIQRDKHYKIKINQFGRELNYEGSIVYLEKEEFGLKIAKEGCPLQFKTKDIVSTKEILKPKEENKIFIINSKKKFKNLKKSYEPEF